VRRIIVGITGASGVGYGIRLLEVLRDRQGVESHLLLTGAARKILGLETDRTPAEVEGLAHRVYPLDDLAAPVGSGDFAAAGMAVLPCSVKALSAIVHSYSENLLARAADVTLRDRRPLVLMPWESPLHKGHLDLLHRAADLGAVVLPPMVAFYHRPRTVADVVDQTVGKILDALGVEHHLFTRWGA
jgi:4-hydroxy-3-polyprenylbenzoate decarboxylase